MYQNSVDRQRSSPVCFSAVADVVNKDFFEMISRLLHLLACSQMCVNDNGYYLGFTAPLSVRGASGAFSPNNKMHVWTMSHSVFTIKLHLLELGHPVRHETTGCCLLLWHEPPFPPSLAKWFCSRIILPSKLMEITFTLFQRRWCRC